MKFSSSAFSHVGPWRPTKPPAGWFSHGFLDFSVSCCLSWTGALPSALQLLLPPPPSAEGIFSWAVLRWRSAILSGGKKKINIYRWTARPGLCAVTVAVLCCVWLYIGVHCTSFGTDKKEPLCRQISLMLAHTEQVTQSSVRWAAPALLDCFHAFELNSGFQHSKGYSISPSEISIVLLQRREPNPPLGRTQSLPNWLCEMSSAWRKSMELPSVSGSGMKSEWLLCPVLGYW